MKKLVITVLAIIGIIVVLPIALGILGGLIGLAVKLLTLAVCVLVPVLLVVWLVRALTRDRSVPAVEAPLRDHSGPYAGRLSRIDYRLRRLEDIIAGHRE